MPYYYTKENGDVAGPVSAAQLNQLVDRGELGEKTQVCREGTQQWLGISSIVKIGGKKGLVGIAKSWLSSLALLGVLIIGIAFLSRLSQNRIKTDEERVPVMHVSSTSEPVKDSGHFNPGDVMRSQNLEVVITSVETRKKVGGEFFEETASEGGIYLAVRWNYKNISSKPINMFNQAEIHLIAPDGTQYNEDLGASAAYASQFNIDEKVLSDLNPGIKVNSATVFEVSREAFSDPSRWSLVVEGDSKMKVRLK